jgi:hypothetical protein
MSNKSKGEIIMDEMFFKEQVECFFQAVMENTLLIIIDSKSKGSKAVFSLVYFNKENNNYYTFSWMLRELGFRQSTDDDLFITHCAGRYSLFILDNIGQELKGKGVELPEWWDKEIQNQNAI